MNWFACVSVLLVLSPVAICGQATDLDKGLAARSRGDYAEAVTHLERAVRADPRNEDAKLALAETLAWMERFEEAEALYRNILRQNPESNRAAIGLGRVLLWQLETDQARAVFEESLRKSPHDPDALEGAATAAWWSGDWRAAERYSRLTLEIDPAREDADRIIREIQSLTSPVVRIGSTYINDDQPYRLIQADASYTIFSDPLTKWTVRGGSYLLDHPDRTRSSPFAGLGGATRFPELDLGLSGDLRFLEFPDGSTEILGSIGIDWGPSVARVALSYAKSELLRTRTAIDDHPSVDTFELRVSRLAGRGWTGSASLRNLDYYDGNRGVGADVWVLSRPFEIGPLAVAVGPVVSYRDTEESRFLPGFPTGVYDPYWTPEELLEVRGIVDASASWHNVLIRFHADGGWGEEHVTPESLTREFNPWRVTVSAEMPILKHWNLSAGVGHETTAFYEATQLKVSVARRF